MKNLLMKFQKPLWLLIATLILLVGAFINGYPTFYSDTSAYISSGFLLDTPFDRPITYGLFINLTSLFGESLWGVVFCQTLIFVYLLNRILTIIFPQKSGVARLITIVILAICTGLPWVCGLLMPDIFTPILVMSLLLILVEYPDKKRNYGLYFLFLLAVSMHLSHISFSISFIVFILIMRQIKCLQLKPIISPKPLFIMLGLAIMAIATMGAALSKSKHIFLMGAMVEHGVAKTYLDEYCPTKDYLLCPYKDVLPEKAWHFIWNKDSPFRKIGGRKTTEKEFKEIITATLLQPKYIGLHILASLKATGQQLIRFNAGDGNGSFLKNSNVHNEMTNHFPHELAIYEASLQNKGQLLGLIGKLNTFYICCLCLSLFIWLYGFRFVQNGSIRLFFIIILVSILLNAWVCGTFANAIDRLGIKMMWLLPFGAIIFFWHQFRERFETKNH